MTQEEKELLVKDLCARLPYGVIIHTWYNENIDIKCIGIDFYTYAIAINLDIPIDDDAKVCIDNVKPYLRPMSSLTENEFKELANATELKYEQLELMDWGDDKTLEFYLSEVPQYCVIKVFDWLNKHHFDYRGLITMGLALEAPEGMYNIKAKDGIYAD